MGKPVVHFEIGCKDSPATQKFYTEMFDWTIEPYGPSAMINTGNQAGIMGHITALGHPPHNYVLFYVQVEDLQATLDKVAQLGGKTMIPPTPVPGMGEFAWFADPEGTVVGLWKPVAKV